MQPGLEIVDVSAGESFKVWAHGYPYRTVRWHFHAEYEIHLITATSGRTFVGDHIGVFEPDSLVMTGPGLPHNWISDIPEGMDVEERCLVLQFTASFAEKCLSLFPEAGFFSELLAQSRRGIGFSRATGARARPILQALLAARHAERLALFFRLLGVLQGCPERRPLASPDYRPDPALYMLQPLNHVLSHIERNLAGELRESELAQLSGFSASGFSRAFQRHTGVNFKPYVNGLRLNHACELLIRTDRRVALICTDVGFNNLSNFNRQFAAHKGMSPSEFRERHRRRKS